MPELPEVETVCRGLRPWLEGRKIRRVEVRCSGLRRPLPSDFAARIEGRRIEAVRRRGKYILMPLDDGTVIIAHLGMSGRMTVHDGPFGAPGPHDHLIFETAEGARLVFNDPRRFGLMTLGMQEGLDDHSLLRNLGPEPLDDSFDGASLSLALKRRSGPVKTALMDQKLVAGVGNIYACEALFRAGVSPRRKARSVAGVRAQRLVEALKQVLTEAVESGGASLRNHRQPSGELGYFQHRFAVYGRENQPCPGCVCDMGKSGGIHRIVQSGRSTFFCPQRQR